jgi:hypothetical protein
LKIYFFFTIIISVIFLQCGENSIPIENENDGSLFIHGRVVSNYSSNFNKVYTSTFPNGDSLLKIESEIELDSSFNLKIPVPAENHLSSYTPVNHIQVINGDSIIVIDSIHFTDQNFKYIRYDLYVESSNGITYSLSINLAEFANPTGFAVVGDFYVSYYYFNSENSINGYYKMRIVTADSSREFITNFNINTKVGWNKVVTKFISEVPNKSIYEVTDILDDQGDWIIGARGRFSNFFWML